MLIEKSCVQCLESTLTLRLSLSHSALPSPSIQLHREERMETDQKSPYFDLLGFFMIPGVPRFLLTGLRPK